MDADAAGQPPDNPVAVDDALPPARPRRRLKRRIAVAAVVVTAIGAAAIGEYVTAGADDGTPRAVEPEPAATKAPETTTSTSTTTTLPPTTTTTIPPLAQPAAVALPPVPGGAVDQGSRAAEVMAYEARLVQLHFDPGPVDGVFDEKTRFAVEAVDKMMGWPRDGVIDQAWVDAVASFQYPAPLVPTGEGDRVEIDLDRQVLTMYKGWQVALVTTTSTGNGKRFCGGDDGCQYAVTPAGRYVFSRHIDGWRTGKLGRLYSPWYFNGGIAVHGYPSVPTKPASHGCARIPMHIAEYFGTLAYHDMAVYVLGIQAPQGGYPADSPNGGSASSSGSRPPAAPPTTAPPPPPPPDTAPPTTAPPTTAPPTTAPPTTAPPTTAPPTTTPTTVGGSGGTTTTAPPAPAPGG